MPTLPCCGEPVFCEPLGSTKSSEDAEYRAFVRETDFDYQQDIQALAGATDGAQLFFVVRGSFAWNRLRQYASRHGGGCGDEVCSVPTSRPGRWASFLPIQSNVIGLGGEYGPECRLSAFSSPG